MNTRIYVPLDLRLREALIAYAMKQYRDPRVQAVLFIERGLQQAGALQSDQLEQEQPAQFEVKESSSHGPK